MINKYINDVVYYSTLVGCLALGSQYKKSEGYEMKRNYGTGLGILVACLICGRFICYACLMIWGNIVVIKVCDRRYIHILSLSWTWLCLIYIHINIIDEMYVIWLHQNMALRLVGLAFELHTDDKSSAKQTSTKIIISEPEPMEEPTSMDIVSYAFFFLGLHKGPYYKWKILHEHMHGSFGGLGDCRIITERKLKKVAVCLLGHSILSYKYSPKVYYDVKFYLNYDMDTRYIYNIPLLVMFYLKMQIVMLLCTCVCTEAGFGVYPVKCQPLPGLGPSTRYSLLRLTKDPDKALSQEYNFSMLKCFDNEKIVTGPRMSDTIKSWDMSTQYWFSTYIYRSIFPRSSKEIRGILSFLAWTLWKGTSLQQLIISSTLWVYIQLESEYSQLYNMEGSMRSAWNIGFSIMRMFCLIYITPCLVVKDAAVVLNYYNSMFWIFHIIMIVSIAGAIVIYKSRQHQRL